MNAPFHLFRTVVLSCAVVFFSLPGYSDTVPALRDLTTSGDTMPPSQAVVHQCGGLLRFKLDVSDSFVRHGNLDLAEDDIYLMHNIYGYFQGQAQATKMLAGLDAETANYESGLSMIAYAQLYRAMLIEMMENGDAFDWHVAAEFDICKTIFMHYQ